MLTPEQCKELEAIVLAWVTAQSQYERNVLDKVDVIKAASKFAALLASLTEHGFEQTLIKWVLLPKNFFYHRARFDTKKIAEQHIKKLARPNDAFILKIEYEE